MNRKTMNGSANRQHKGSRDLESRAQPRRAKPNPCTVGVMLADPSELLAIDQDEAYQLMEYAGLTMETMDDVMRGAMATFEERRDLCWGYRSYHRSTIYEVCGITERMYRRDDGLIRILMDNELLAIPAEDVRKGHFAEFDRERYQISTDRGLLTVFQFTVDSLSSILEDEWIDEHWDEMEKATNEG